MATSIILKSRNIFKNTGFNIKNLLVKYRESLFNIGGRRNRTLHLYVVTATNLGLWSSDPEPTQRRRTACGQDLVVVIGVKGGGEKFSDGEILKTTTVGPL